MLWDNYCVWCYWVDFKMKIINVVGARPNFMKIAPLMKEYNKYPEIKALLVHTGQHYDKNMSDSFFNDLEIPKPDHNLGISSGSHAEQTAKIMIEFEKVCLKEKPDLVLVVGDVNSTIACALVAVKLGIKVAHVEAGLRSFDRTMPEETNRLLVDQISDFLFVTEQSGLDNLEHEGISNKKIFFVGNIMIDSLIYHLPKIKKSDILNKLNLNEKNFIILTMHRPNNVDNENNLKNMFNIINEVQKKIKVVYPIHPRTKTNIKKFGFENEVNKIFNLSITEPLNYIDFLNLILNSKAILTDSGGIQEETTFLGVPCITLRENTERPVTVDEGTNILTGNNKKKIINLVNGVLKNNWKKGTIPKLWDGKTSKRIVEVLRNEFFN